MIRTLIASTFFVLSLSCTPPSKPRQVAITEIGAPMGTPLTQMIGPAGGTFASTDGTLQVTIPANAVSAMTAFTLVPIETKSPGGVRSFRLGPEGTTFTSPVTLTFKYTDDDTLGSTPEAFNIVFQDADRSWRRAPSQLNVDAKTITAKTLHFSDWSYSRSLFLEPAQPTVKVGGNVAVSVVDCRSDGPTEDDLQPVSDVRLPGILGCENVDESMLMKGPWVEGVLGGNSTVGTASQTVPFTYTAPAKRPKSNPVALSIEIPQGKGKFIVISRVKVIDGIDSYTGTITLNGHLSKTALPGDWTLKLISTAKFAFQSPGTFVLVPKETTTNVQSLDYKMVGGDCSLGGRVSITSGGVLTVTPTSFSPRLTFFLNPQNTEYSCSTNPVTNPTAQAVGLNIECNPDFVPTADVNKLEGTCTTKPLNGSGETVQASFLLEAH